MADGTTHGRSILKDRTDERGFLVGFARAYGGAIIFVLPLTMTMEMWWLGFYMDPSKLALFLAASIPLLTGLAYFSGFKRTPRLLNAVVDGFVSLAVGFSTCAALLLLVGIIDFGMSLDEVVGKIALQAVPGAIGASLARSQLGGSAKKPGQSHSGQRETDPSDYFSELFIMTIGALFLAFNVAPTQEMVVIAFKISNWHVVILVTLTVLLMHAFVYTVEFKGQSSIPPHTPFWSVFVRYTVAGYAVALLVSVYVLWTFGRFAGLAPDQALQVVFVLGFPAGLGAAAARLII